MTKHPAHPASLAESELLSQCRITRTKRGGPGGQHRNKTESAVVIEHLPTGVRSEAGERRSQHENRRVAIERLRINLAISVRSAHLPPRDKPSELWQSRCKGSRIEVSTSHQDFAGLLAEAIDQLAIHDFDQRPTAEFLGCSASQLVKFLKQEPLAFQFVNRERSKRDLATLR